MKSLMIIMILRSKFLFDACIDANIAPENMEIINTVINE